jgi:hypothetical protein
MHETLSMLRARKSLMQRFHSGFNFGRECIAIVDVLRFLLSVDPLPALMKLPGVRTVQSHFIRPSRSNTHYAYGRVHWFKRTDSKMKFCVESVRQHGYLAPYSLTAYADDKTGLLPAEVFPILNVAPGAKLTMMELACDFSPLSSVTRDFVLRHGVFGKCWRDLSMENPAGDWWGAKRGGKRVTSYFKDEICGHRVELRMRSRFLNRYGIDGVYDFGRFVRILPRRHIFFAALSDERLTGRLRGSDFSTGRTLGILRRVNEMNGDLSATLTYLRRQVGLKNVQRLLIPLPENRLVLEALESWAEMWPSAPGRLGKKRG